jgi:hypothetical protein
MLELKGCNFIDGGARLFPNPYESPMAAPETPEVRHEDQAIHDRSMFWRGFAVACVATLVIDAALCPFMYPFTKRAKNYLPTFFPEGVWLIANLPGLPVSAFTARRSYGEPVRFLVKSAGIAAVHWGTLVGIAMQLINRRRSRPMSPLEILLVIALNVVIPWALVQGMAFYEWDMPPGPTDL